MRRVTRLMGAALVVLLAVAAARAEAPSIDELRRQAAKHAREVGPLSCRVRIQDVAGTLQGMLKIKDGMLMLDAERRNAKGRTLGREKMIDNRRTVYVLAVPRGKTIPNVVKMDISAINAQVKRIGDVQIARPDFCGNPLTALLDLSESYHVEVVAEGTFGQRRLVDVRARRKPLSAREPMWGAAEKISLQVDPANGFAYYVGKFDKDDKRIWEQFVSQIIPAAKVPDKTFEYNPPAQANVQDVAETLAQIPAPGAEPQP